MREKTQVRLSAFLMVMTVLAPLATRTLPAGEASVGQARQALRRAVRFFRREVAVGGGYLWRYRADLSRGEGERPAPRTMVWVQPPGTPAVGAALLDAYRLCGEPGCLAGAREAAHALVRGQLHSGGWDYRIEFDPQRRKQYAYRDAPPGPGSQNTTTLDDDTTQSALRYLMRVDDQLDHQDSGIHGAARYALERLLQAQYPNGAWPQRFSEPPDPGRFPVQRATYPETWPREYPDRPYYSYYTLNDNTLSDMICTFLEAAAVYDSDDYRKAAERGGDFVLLAQMPAPQPAWAQQYDRHMHPAWARKFEPPAITGSESQRVVRTLLLLFEATGNQKYLEPIPAALDYLEASRLPDGRLARFYELGTNRPLFFTKDYKLTYEPDDVPGHYGFFAACRTKALRRSFERAQSGRRAAGNAPSNRQEKPLANRAARIIASLDERGAWTEPGRLREDPSSDADSQIIDCKTFAHNVRSLAQYIADHP